MMTRFLRDLVLLVVGGVLVNLLLAAWDVVSAYPPRVAEPVSGITLVPTARPATAPTRPPTFTPAPTTAPLPTLTPAPPGVQVIYVFNLAPTRVWFDKADALAYREAVLDGNPVRPYISPDKSRTVRGGRLLVLAQEDGLIMVRTEDGNVMGWMQ